MEKKNRNHNILTTSRAKVPGIEECNGCSVCMLSCPLWLQTRDPFLPFCGRTRTMQGGASPAEVRDALDACILCGSCEALCSFDMDTIAKTIDSKGLLEHFIPESPEAQKRTTSKYVKGRILLANSLLQESRGLLSKTLDVLGSEVTLYDDNGEDISEAIERYGHLRKSRVSTFLASIKTADEIITTDGLIYRLIRHNLPSTKVVGLGEALIRYSDLAEKVKPDDLYIIDPRTYHANFGVLVDLYDTFGKRTGCLMNRDLHRVATPTGVTLFHRDRSHNVIDPVKQIQWILEGKRPNRIIVEKLEDRGPFTEVADIPVLFVGEVL